tara:strand:+ start:592 stop:696 length:105 start_codon:yes stop_codon:yes gene_type:complete
MVGVDAHKDELALALVSGASVRFVADIKNAFATA